MARDELEDNSFSQPSMRIKKQFTSVSRVDAHVVIAGRKDSSWRVYDTRLGSRVTEVCGHFSSTLGSSLARLVDAR